MALADTAPICSGHQVHRTGMRRSVVLTSGASRRQAAALEGKRQRMLKCAASEQYGHVRMICGGKGAPRSTCGAIVAEAPDGRFLDKVPGLVEFHLLNNGSEGEDCRSGASSKCREARGLFGAACFWAVHQPLHRQRRLRRPLPNCTTRNSMMLQRGYIIEKSYQGRQLPPFSRNYQAK